MASQRSPSRFRAAVIWIIHQLRKIAQATTQKFEVKGHGASAHSNDGMAVSPGSCSAANLAGSAIAKAGEEEGKNLGTGAAQRESSAVETAPTGSHTRPGEIDKPQDFNVLVYQLVGLLKELWAVVHNNDTPPQRRREILLQWEGRIERLDAQRPRQDSPAPTLQAAWQTTVSRVTGHPAFAAAQADDRAAQRIAAAWLEALHAWGMTRDEASEFLMDEDREQAYSVVGPYTHGERVEVVHGCWWYEGKLIEQGIAKGGGGSTAPGSNGES
jgi:hypothetical protein